MKHTGKEPFPTIYVDVKPDSEAAKNGAKYEVIAKAQLKKVTKKLTRLLLKITSRP